MRLKEDILFRQEPNSKTINSSYRSFSLDIFFFYAFLGGKALRRQAAIPKSLIYRSDEHLFENELVCCAHCSESV